MRVYLTGFMGSGKTTVGRLLADRLGCVFVDLDATIVERAGKSIVALFAEVGEPGFRALEREALVATLALPEAVVATGGGTVTLRDFAELVHRNGVAVWLHPPFATIARRIGSLGKLDRPLFRSEEQALQLYRERLPAYRRADVTVEVSDDESAAEVAARIELLLRRR